MAHGRHSDGEHPIGHGGADRLPRRAAVHESRAHGGSAFNEQRRARVVVRTFAPGNVRILSTKRTENVPDDSPHAPDPEQGKPGHDNVWFEGRVELPALPPGDYLIEAGIGSLLQTNYILVRRGDETPMIRWVYLARLMKRPTSRAAGRHARRGHRIFRSGHRRAGNESAALPRGTSAQVRRRVRPKHSTLSRDQQPPSRFLRSSR